jgi:putative PEP-CTERM system histidine kinase
VARVSSFVLHDLKNMTSTLSLMLDNANEYIDDPEFQQDMIGTLKSTVNKMKSLMDRLKEIPDKQQISAVHSDLAVLAEDVLRELPKLNGAVRITKELKKAPAMVDTEEIKKVLLNILLNAIEATAPSGGDIFIETGTEEGFSFIRVSDTGSGMTEEFMKEHLFKPFRTTKKKGLGIGLYQCKQIVEAHKGTIKVKSAHNSGTEVTILIPAVSTPSLTHA